ncbi:MAG TPA: alpha/beta hydrolase [Propionibacteriaceae bacterium]|nr:alpha/beta hydrolase [Propionibacteriaceae bacterium]
MVTRANLVDPEERTTTSFSSPTLHRDVSFVRLGALRLRISRQGQGPPLLLLGGLGNSLGVWDNLVGELPDVQTIAVDAPGTGFSSTPALPLSMAELAELYANLLRFLELDTVSVLGLSFGGAVAQQLAYQSPGLVRRLVLCGTGPGIGGLPGAPSALQELASPARYYSAARSRRVTPLIYGGRFAREPERFNREVQQRLAAPPSVYGYYCQLAALVGWSSLPWLSRIEAPTLVLAGDADPVYPLENATMLSTSIPNARVEVLRGGGHLFVMDSASDIAPSVRAFLSTSGHSPRGV